VKVGGHPMESVSHGLRKEYGGKECKAIKNTIVPINQTSRNLSHLFSMEDIKNSVASR
jgi:hypothetical protein